MVKSLNAEIRALVAEIKVELRGEGCRLKDNVDYAIIVKYNEIHILCPKVYEDLIREVVAKYNLQINSMHTY
jgi:hypothetical protein